GAHEAHRPGSGPSIGGTIPTGKARFSNRSGRAATGWGRRDRRDGVRAAVSAGNLVDVEEILVMSVMRAKPRVSACAPASQGDGRASESAGTCGKIPSLMRLYC